MIAFLRSRIGIAVAAIGLLVAAIMFLFAPFSDDTTAGGRLFFSVVIGIFAALAAWNFAGIPALVVDIVKWARGRASRPTAPSPHHVGPLPALNAARKTVVNRIIAGLTDHGVLGPDRPDPALAYPGVADFDGVVTADIVLGALGEADYYFPGTDPSRFFHNLFFLDTKAEQHPDYLQSQVTELARIGGLAIADIVIDAPWPPQGRTMPVTVSMQADGVPLTISYLGDVKYHSTHIAVALARAIDAANKGRRLAAIGSDQGFWISAIDAHARDTLNAALKRTKRHEDYWDWVSDWTPYGAGDSA